MTKCIKCKKNKKSAYSRAYCSECLNVKNLTYKKTINGFLLVSYGNMKNRVTGKNKKSAHLYVGKELLTKESFYNFSKNSKDFLKLYKYWVMNDYNRKLTPSINRVDSNKGYTLDNIEWITLSQNSSLSQVTKRLKKNESNMILKIVGIKHE